MKVLHLLGPLRPSGMERMLVSAAPHFANAGLESVVVGQGPDHPFADDLRAAGYRVVIIDSLRSAKASAAWRRVLADEQPDAVHIHTEAAFSVSIITARLTVPDARIIRTFHNYFLASGWWGLKRRCQGFVSDRFVDAFVCLSDEMAMHEASFGRKSVVIPNWVDAVFLEAPPGKCKDVDLVLVGNCSEVKNHEVVLASALDRQWTVAHLGDERDAPASEGEALAALDAAGLLCWRGVGDTLPWMQRARVFAMPSTREGFPVALAEAVSLGLVCVVADSPGFEWAAEYPLVASAPARGVPSAWGTTIDRAIQASQTERTAGLATAQRDLARGKLAASVGVSRYIRVYEGEGPLGV